MTLDGAKPQAARVAICIPSHRRPEGLARLLRSLRELAFSGEPPAIRLVVIDNDANESARAVCDEAAAWLDWPLRYVVEPRKGIPFARNAAVTAAADSDWIAFIDDDETPEPHWLDHLLWAQHEFEADVVTGPVRADFERQPADWIVEGGFFESPPRDTGALLETAYTHNVLVRTASLLELPTLFDERFTLGVGEDRDVFERIASAGRRIVWCEEAVVHESIPAERARFRWLLRRGYRIGTATTHIDRVRDRSGALRALAHGAWCLTKGLLGSGVALAGRRADAARSLQLASYGLGRWSGLAGVR